MKQSIDIEDLLIWAYRDQCVDRTGRIDPMASKVPGWRVASQFWMLGTRVDKSLAATTTLSRPEAPSDALTVHDAVLSLGDMWIEKEPGTGAVMVWDDTEIEAAAWKRVHTARGWMLLKPDAREIDLVRECPVTQAITVAVLVTNAKTASRPETYIGWKRPRGRPRRIPYANGAAQGGDVHVTTMDDVVHARAMYGVWHAAMAALAAELEGALDGYEVTGPKADPEPWANVESVRVRPDLREKEMQSKPMKRKRKKRR